MRGDWGNSDTFNIRAGVRQGCALSPRLFCCLLQWAMEKWRTKVGDLGLDLDDTWMPLVDLRYADDILLFGTSDIEVCQLLDMLMQELPEVGLILNASKTVALTTMSQPPSI